MSINIQKMKVLPKVAQKYVFSKITLKSSTIPHSQNSIGYWPFLTVFGNPKSD